MYCMHESLSSKLQQQPGNTRDHLQMNIVIILYDVDQNLLQMIKDVRNPPHDPPTRLPHPAIGLLKSKGSKQKPHAGFHKAS